MYQISWIKTFLNIFRVDQDFNFSAFHKFGFWDKFMYMVEDAYTYIKSKIKISGLLPDPFTLTWGVCQGCLFSVLLYIIGAEVLASFINANKRIKGIQVGDHEIKIVNIGDDATIFLRDTTCHKGFYLPQGIQDK